MIPKWGSSELDDFELEEYQNEKAYAIAIHPVKSYCAKAETGNMNGDTVVVVFDDGIMVRWLLPNGLIDDNALYPQNTFLMCDSVPDSQ